MGYGLMFLVAGGALAIIGLVLFWTQPLFVLGALERLTPKIVYRVRTHLPLVALSFDDGPHPTFTPQVLEIPERQDAKATFFLIGERVLRHADILARIKAGGHEVGNHYVRNAPTLGHSDAESVRNLEQTERALGGTEGLKFLRPPGEAAWSRQIELARERGLYVRHRLRYPHDPMHPPVLVYSVACREKPGSRSHRHPSRRHLGCQAQPLSPSSYSGRGTKEGIALRFDRRIDEGQSP